MLSGRKRPIILSDLIRFINLSVVVAAAAAAAADFFDGLSKSSSNDSTPGKSVSSTVLFSTIVCCLVTAFITFFAAWNSGMISTLTRSLRAKYDRVLLKVLAETEGSFDSTAANGLVSIVSDKFNFDDVFIIVL